MPSSGSQYDNDRTVIPLFSILWQHPIIGGGVACTNLCVTTVGRNGYFFNPWPIYTRVATQHENDSHILRGKGRIGKQSTRR